MFATTRTLLKTAASSTKSSEFSKLPKDVQRELLRHVKPSPSTVSSQQWKVNGSASSSQAYNSTKNKGATKVLLACTVFMGCAASIPYIATAWITNLTDRDDPLTRAQVRRGAFQNSGSIDAGKDPNWDWKQGKYVYPPGFAEHLKQQSPEQTDLGPDLVGPAVRDEQQRRRRNQ